MLNLSETSTETHQPLHPQGQSRIKTTADIIGVHHQTLRRWWQQGKFPRPTNINGILLFRNADIVAWLDKQHATNADSATELMEA